MYVLCVYSFVYNAMYLHIFSIYVEIFQQVDNHKSKDNDDNIAVFIKGGNKTLCLHLSIWHIHSPFSSIV